MHPKSQRIAGVGWRWWTASRACGSLLALMLLAQVAAGTAQAASGFTTLADFPVPGGHFYSQASGQGLDAGFAIVDDNSGMLYSEFQRLGSVDRIGYPASQRFGLNGLVTQATQRELLQWSPANSRVSFLNVFDVMSDRGLDPLLAQTRLIPPTGDNRADGKLTWPQVVARHLALLDQAPAIRARYFSDAAPIDDFGLPQGIGDFGGVQVVRCERAAFQFWRVATPFAKPGDVTQVNAGDLAKELGIVPPTATVPSAVGSEMIAPPGRVITPDSATETAALSAADAAKRSLVRVDVTFDGGVGIASGIVVDSNGDVLTNQHVVDGATTIRLTYDTGATSTANVAGADAAIDLAILQPTIAPTGPGVIAATMLGGDALTSGQYVVTLGYSPYFASSPAVRLGVYQGTLAGTVAVLRTDSFMLPGDSGGMLLDLSGNVVGVNDEIQVSLDAAQPIVGYSIDAAEALRVGQRLLASHSP